MKIYQKIFRAYDIRGIWPKEINKEVAYFVGKAFCKFLQKEYKITSPKIVVGFDSRISSPQLYQAIKQGIWSGGGEVKDLGFCSTPLNYFAIWFRRADGGIMITASHNPKEYNGFKLSLRKVRALSEEKGTKILYQTIIRLKKTPPKQKKTEKIEILDDYLNFLEKHLTIKNFSSLNLVIDFSNGSIGPIFQKVAEKFSVSFKPLFLKPDGRFPHHDPNPLKKENQKFIKRYLKKGGFDLGVMFDGDGDRVYFLDEKGNFIRSDYILAILAEFYLKKAKSKYIVCDLRASRGVEETIKKQGGRLIKSKVGYPFIKKKMERYKAFLGGELSGHYFWQETSYSEMSILTLLRVLEILIFKKKPLSFLIGRIAKYFASDEINFEVEDKEKKIEEMKRFYRDGKISQLDGLTVEYQDWWFNIRPSNTEPVLRLTVEAKTEKLLQRKIKEISQRILAS